LGDRHGIAYTMTSMGTLACEQGDYAAARTLHQEALAILRDLGDRWSIALSLEALAFDTANIAGPGRAARLWGAAERLREEISAPIPLSERSRYDERVVAARAAFVQLFGNDIALGRD